MMAEETLEEAEAAQEIMVLEEGLETEMAIEIAEEAIVITKKDVKRFF